MPQGSASAELEISTLSKHVNRNLRIFMAALHFNFDLDATLAIFFAVADPDMTQLLPVLTAFVNREPRPCHKVDAFESQPDPNVIQTNSLDRPTGDQWLDILGLHFKLVSSIERNASRIDPGAHNPLIIFNPN